MKDTLQVNVKALAALCESNYMIRNLGEFGNILKKWVYLFYPHISEDECNFLLSFINIHYRSSEDTNDYYIEIGGRFFYKTLPAELMVKGSVLAEILLTLCGYSNFINCTIRKI